MMQTLRHLMEKQQCMLQLVIYMKMFAKKVQSVLSILNLEAVETEKNLLESIVMSLYLENSFLQPLFLCN